MGRMWSFNSRVDLSLTGQQWEAPELPLFVLLLYLTYFVSCVRVQSLK